MPDLTVEILKEIRDEIRQTNVRVDQMRTEITEGIDRLEQRQGQTEVRLATEIVAVAGAIGDLREVLLRDRKLRDSVEDHERRIKALEGRAS